MKLDTKDLFKKALKTALKGESPISFKSNRAKLSFSGGRDKSPNGKKGYRVMAKLKVKF